MYPLRKWKRLLTAFCAIMLCLCSAFTVSATEGVELPDAYYAAVQTNAVTNWPQGPAVWAESAVVMDIDTGIILYSKNMDETKYPASITKVMTTLLAIENSSLTDSVYFSENAIWGIERDSSHIGIRVGEILSMKDCLYGMMLESANEVCIAVAEHVSGSVEAFAELMNQRAAELGCTNTHFTNPNGLPDENHYTTAHDMALIAQAAYRNPVFRQVCSAKTYCIPTTNITGEVRWLANHHKMLPDTSEYSYEFCTGGKTGYTQVALNTLVTYAEKDGKRLVCISLRTNGKQYYIDTASMLDYAFNNFQNVTVYSRSTSAKAHMEYPSLHFGQPVTIDSLRPTTRVTIPATASMTDVMDTVTTDENGIHHTYQYNGYTVGSESISSEPLKMLLTSKPEEKAAAYNGKTTAKEQQAQSTPSFFTRFANALRDNIIIVIIMIVLLIILIIMLLIKRRINQRRRMMARRRAAQRRRREAQQAAGTGNRAVRSTGSSSGSTGGRSSSYARSTGGRSSASTRSGSSTRASGSAHSGSATRASGSSRSDSATRSSGSARNASATRSSGTSRSGSATRTSGTSRSSSATRNSGTSRSSSDS